MNSSAYDIRDMLVAAGLSLVKGTSIFLAQEPTNPDNTVTVFDTPGLPNDLTLDKEEKYERPSVQIRVRNNNYQTGWALANNIKNTLHGRANETWGAAYYSLIEVVSDPSMLDYDNNGRPRFILNISLQRYPTR